MKIINGLFLVLTSCGFGYEVKDKSKTEWAVTKAIFYCIETKPVLFFDNVVAICDTQKECNVICSNRRIEAKL